jgi:glucose-1-phosphate cytidylyltransferase
MGKHGEHWQGEMKAVILAGGLGTRLAEETQTRPKPMIDIGGRPLLWHVMKGYAAHDITDFVICCGHKGYMIKEFFANYFLHTSDVTFDLASRSMEVHNCHAEPWRITLVDTGEHTQTGGRLRRVAPYLRDEERFCFTYGDGVADVDITGLLLFHLQHGLAATVTAVRPPGRFGSLTVDGGRATGFHEKPAGDGAWINGGFFVLDHECIDRVKDDATAWEQEPMAGLAADAQLGVYYHEGLWQPVDTLRDKQQLVGMWERGELPWKA